MSRVITSFSGILASLAVAGLSVINSTARADATLVYETVTADAGKTEHTFSIIGRFIRVDMDSDPNRHWIIDTGLLTMADVNREKQQYTFEKLPRPPLPVAAAADEKKPDSMAAAQQPEASESSSGEHAAGTSQDQANEVANVTPMLSPEPTLAPTRKKASIAGIGCRVVIEKFDKQAVAEHCMAGTGELGVNSREMITLSRLFTTARRLGLGWAGVATADERIVAIKSNLLESEASQLLKSVSYENIADEIMQVPKSYRRIKPEKQQADEAIPSDTGSAVPGSG